jgi:hypothetical protein
MVPAAAPSNRFAHGWQTGRPVTVVVTAGDLRHSLHVSAMDYPRSTVLTGNDRARRANLSLNAGKASQQITSRSGELLEHQLEVVR